MKWTLIIIIVAMAMGCSGGRSSQVQTASTCGQLTATAPAANHLPAPQARNDSYTEGGGAALVFMPAMTIGLEPVMLYRDQREPAAYVGYDEVFATFSYTRQDDRMADDGTDRFVRRSVNTRVGVSWR